MKRLSGERRGDNELSAEDGKLLAAVWQGTVKMSDATERLKLVGMVTDPAGRRKK